MVTVPVLTVAAPLQSTPLHPWAPAVTGPTRDHVKVPESDPKPLMVMSSEAELKAGNVAADVLVVMVGLTSCTVSLGVPGARFTSWLVADAGRLAP